MQPRDTPISDIAPTASILTDYDRQHASTYLRLLDAESDGADWKDVARIVLYIDPARESDRARHAWKATSPAHSRSRSHRWRGGISRALILRGSMG